MRKPGTRRCLAVLALLGITAGCTTRESFETEMMVAELQVQVAELQTQLDYLYTEMSRISAELNENVGELERALEGIHLRVLDLQGPGEPELARREIEAAVAVANQRIAAVRSTTAELARTLTF